MKSKRRVNAGSAGSPRSSSAAFSRTETSTAKLTFAKASETARALGFRFGGLPKLDKEQQSFPIKHVWTGLSPRYWSEIRRRIHIALSPQLDKSHNAVTGNFCWTSLALPCARACQDCYICRVASKMRV